MKLNSLLKFSMKLVSRSLDSPSAGENLDEIDKLEGVFAWHWRVMT